MRITKKQLKRIIREAMADPTGHVPDPYEGSDVENGYVAAVRKIGTRSVIQGMLQVLAEKGITDEDHREILRLLK